MTSLAERRRWMRYGCPVPEETSVPDAVISLCEVYWLQAEGGKPCESYEARIALGCGCGAEIIKSKVITPGPTGLWAGNDLNLEVSIMCRYMADHAEGSGMPMEEAQEAFNHAPAYERVLRWALGMMSGLVTTDPEGMVEVHGCRARINLLHEAAVMR